MGHGPLCTGGTCSAYPTFASNDDDTTNAAPKIALLDMDRSHFLHFAWGRTWEQCQWQRPSFPSLFRDRSCRGLSPTTVCDWLFPWKISRRKYFREKGIF